ncbi:unnamed protein product [Choristocarpus tenellus]
MAAVLLYLEHDLHDAAKRGETEAVSKLVMEQRVDVDRSDPYGYTPLHWAAQKGHADIVRLLVGNGALVNVRDKWKRTPLHRAAKEGHVEVVKALLEAGAEINAQGDANWTPLHCGSFHGRLDVVKMLVDSGADPTATDDRGRSATVLCDMALYDVDENGNSADLLEEVFWL